MALTCKQATRISLATLGGHAAEAERLELEDHFGACTRCGQEHMTALALVHGLGAVEPEGLTSVARAEVRQALAARGPAATGPTLDAPWVRRLGLRLSLAGAGIAFAIVAAVLIGRGAVRIGPYAVVAGDVTVAAAAAGDGPVTFRAVGGGRIRLAEAGVDLDGTTEIDWHRGLGRVDLHKGRVTVDVPHRPGQHFEVRTPRFTVQVVGTRFQVDLRGVRTERGAVQVIRPDGSIAARVEAGQSWTAGAPDVAAVGAAAVGASAAGTSAVGAWAAGTSARPVGSQASVAALPDRGGEARRRVSADARAPADARLSGRLGEARRALARGDAPGARRIVTPLFHLGRDVGVEARILFAESFLVEGRYADAIDGYRVVARDFPGTNQAESSAFAVAQLAAEHGRTSDARVALQAYLGRYPHGRFAREAADRLERLSPGAR